MNKEEFLVLVKQYSNETTFLSYLDTNHPAYIKLLTGDYKIVPWLLERLQDSIGHDYGDTMDRDNDLWLSTGLLAAITDGECAIGFQQEYAGQLDKVREHILQWGRQHKFI